MEEIIWNSYDAMECEEMDTVVSDHIAMTSHEELKEDSPGTPVNNISVVSVDYDENRPSTPPNNISVITDNLFCTPANDTSFIKRVGMDKLMNRAMPGLTSTPLMERDGLSTTLPPFGAPKYTLLKSMRHCKSLDNVKRPKLALCGIPYEYVNPFTPDGKMLNSKIKAQKKFQRLSLNVAPPKFDMNSSSDLLTQSTEAQANEAQASKAQAIEKQLGEQPAPELDLDDIPSRAPLREFNVSRFNEEFEMLEVIGKGEHGCVYKCVKRLNGIVYAVKRTITPVKSGIQERTVRNEVYAHGVLDHPNIVRYFSAWKEDGYVFIQNEFCNGGNLESYLEKNTMSEPLLRTLLLQISSALKYMHKMGLAHMDIKPSNIFLCTQQNKDSSVESDGGFGDDDKADEITFKLGDLGHVSRLDEDDAEEGDCRYLSREVIEDRYTTLDSADVFSLGLTLYEAAGAGPLPKNGVDWHEIRNGNLEYFSSFSKDFNDIVKNMVDPSADKRPTAADLVEMLKPSPPSPRPEDVSTYIQQYRRNHTRLEHRALATNQYLKELYKSHRQMQEQLHKEKGTSPKGKLVGRKKGAVTKTRVVGRKTKRSSSNTI